MWEWVAEKAEGFWEQEKHEAAMRKRKREREKEKVGDH